MKFDIERSYWNFNGRYETLAKKYFTLIPKNGPSNNEYIEYLRCACNIYHHLHLTGIFDLKFLEKWVNVLLKMVKNPQLKHINVTVLDLQNQIKENSNDIFGDDLYQSIENIIDLILYHLQSVPDLFPESDESYEDSESSNSDESEESDENSEPEGETESDPMDTSDSLISQIKGNLMVLPPAEEDDRVVHKENQDLYRFLMLFSKKYFNERNTGRGNAFKNAAKTIEQLNVPANTLFKPEEPAPKLKYIGDYMYGIILEYLN